MHIVLYCWCHASRRYISQLFLFSFILPSAFSLYSNQDLVLDFHYYWTLYVQTQQVHCTLVCYNRLYCPQWWIQDFWKRGSNIIMENFGMPTLGKPYPFLIKPHSITAHDCNLKFEGNRINTQSFTFWMHSILSFGDYLHVHIPYLSV